MQIDAGAAKGNAGRGGVAPAQVQEELSARSARQLQAEALRPAKPRSRWRVRQLEDLAPFGTRRYQVQLKNVGRARGGIHTDDHERLRAAGGERHGQERTRELHLNT